MESTEPLVWRHVIECDATGCDSAMQSARHGRPSSPWETASQFAAQARAAGWTIWRGTRIRRHYCRDHGPKPGHSMRQLTQ